MSQGQRAEGVVSGGPDPHRVVDSTSLVRELDLLRIRAARGSRKTRMSIDDLHRKFTDVPRSTLANYLNGKHFPPADLFDRIVIALGASATEQRAWSEAWFAASEQRLNDRWSFGRTAPAATPRELPGAVPGFVGRREHLRMLGALLDGATADMTIAVITGTAGVGKTALAVQWAHSVSPRFPDGQLYLDLQGFAPGDPMSPSDALAAFLGSLGVRPDEIPRHEAERAARYRTLLAERRMLVILDNVQSPAHVRPLLPGSPTCLVVVTSRHSMSGLVTGEGATRITLDPMPGDDAIRLLRNRIGARIDEELDAVTELIGRCARLPLPLCILAEHMAMNPKVAFAAVVHEFTQANPLDLLDTGEDARTDIRSVFSWSLTHLQDDAATVFRLLGLHPGHDFDAYIIAALADVDLAQARRLSTALRRAHLLESRGDQNRYGMHDLLRAYSVELAATIPEAARHAAIGRLMDYYLHAAMSAVQMIEAGDEEFRPQARPISTVSPEFGSSADADDWLAVERANIVRVAVYAAEHENHSRAIDLAQTMNRHVHSGGFHAEVVGMLTPALHAARRHQDARGEAYALTRLGIVHAHLGDYRAALDHSSAALAVCRRITQLLADTDLAESRHFRGGRIEPVAITRAAAFRFGEAVALSNLGIVYTRLGRYDEALTHQQRALELMRQSAIRVMEVPALANLGEIHLGEGRYQEAVRYGTEALQLARQSGHRAFEGTALTCLGNTHEAQGRHDEAENLYREAHTIAVQTDNLRLEAESLDGLGRVLHKRGEHAKALSYHTDALLVARSIEHRHEWATALTGAAHAQRALGLGEHARQLLREALTIYTELGVPEADVIRTRLHEEECRDTGRTN
ncbi:tetratricopeptide repeat protein [Nocardia sp. BMG111209]|uniref:tetratricopeptide repeat protein n=1 Tax=Nocardia sp. BMG111209 TaxID=1160137 RepID=UPI00037EB4AF|nr:tetratricopeptide repeat protein [Nocardia sp. BMG111209]